VSVADAKQHGKEVSHSNLGTKGAGAGTSTKKRQRGAANSSSKAAAAHVPPQYTPLDVHGGTLTQTEYQGAEPVLPLDADAASLNNNDTHTNTTTNSAKKVSPSTSHRKKAKKASSRKGSVASEGNSSVDDQTQNLTQASNLVSPKGSGGGGSRHGHGGKLLPLSPAMASLLQSPNVNATGNGSGSGNNSRSGSNHAKSSSSSKKALAAATLTAPPPTTTLHNFFKPSTTHYNHSHKQQHPRLVPSSKSKISVSGGGFVSGSDAHAHAAPPCVQAFALTATNSGGYVSASADGNGTMPGAAATAAMRDAYEFKIASLEQSLKEKSDQLQTIQHNRSMVYSSLKTALDQKELLLRTKEEEESQRQQKVSDTLEALLRAQLLRENVELRQQVAQDTARLGRVVYTRTGYTGSMETWEHGHAAVALKKKRQALTEQRVSLETRLKDAKRASKRLSMPPSAAQTQGNEIMTVGGLEIRNPLDAMEAEESAKRQLNELSLKEVKLAEQEGALNIEIATHVRHMKRVSNEDASRFGQHHPKLHDRYLPMQLLGKGGFSEVWQAYDLTELKQVAVKIHQIDPRWSESKRESYTRHVSREYQIHRNVRHARIVSLFDVFEIDNHSFATILECCQGSPIDLDTLLKERKVLDERDARAILLQILEGMRYLSSGSNEDDANDNHSNNNANDKNNNKKQPIIHYDLKPGNILFDVNGDAKITDFGLSKIVDTADSNDSMELTSQGAGTYWYLPPECFFSGQNIRISNKVDVWSLGVIYYQMVFGKRPFGEGQSQDHVLSGGIMLNAREVKFPSISASSPNKVSQQGKEFIRAALTYDQTFRPTIAELCQHPYLFQKKL
jgi:tousled-like kinase